MNWKSRKRKENFIYFYIWGTYMDMYTCVHTTQFITRMVKCTFLNYQHLCTCMYFLGTKQISNCISTHSHLSFIFFRTYIQKAKCILYFPDRYSSSFTLCLFKCPVTDIIHIMHTQIFICHTSIYIYRVWEGWKVYWTHLHYILTILYQQ